MKVTKRNGSSEDVSFDKVQWRLKNLCDKEPQLNNVNHSEIAQKVISRIYDGVHTYELDELAAQQCTQKGTEHYEYSMLASRLVISNNHKRTSPSFSETIEILYNNRDVNGLPSPLISEAVYVSVQNNKHKLNSYIQYERDYDYDYFSLKTLEKAYLMQINGVIIERIQHLFMRVAVGLYPASIKDALETYDLLSEKYFIHATPTLFHCGAPRPQLLSCFLMEVGDSVAGMYGALKNCALISKWAGGIGCHIHDVRGRNSIIRSTNGKSNGLVPMLKVFNDTARHINQSGKRNGSFAMYLEPWHPDIIQFLDCKKNHGDEDVRARDLFYAMWIPDLFMERVLSDSDWSLMCPDKCPGLSKVYGEAFKQLYERYELDSENIFKTVPARLIWKSILDSQKETGTPYICYKDAVNAKTNQQNLGTIKSSNLCTEIMEYSDENEYACCTLASIGLPKFVEPFNREINSITVLSIPNCKACKYAKKLILAKQYTLENHTVDMDDEDYMSSLEEELGVDSLQFPIIYVDGTYIGGFNELYTLFRPTFNFKRLTKVVERVVKNLNKVIDLNFYPVEETRLSNMKHRPIGIGVQGMADVFALFKYSFDSEGAAKLNKEIFATIYYAACRTSMQLSKERVSDMVALKKQLRGTEFARQGLYDANEFTNHRASKLYHKLKPNGYELDRDTHLGSYSSFIGSPMSKGMFQFDMWGKEPLRKAGTCVFDWTQLRQDVIEHGIRNSLLLAPMPTASTSQIMGNNECIEPFTSNIYSRSTLAGQFIITNKHLQKDLIDIGLWDKDFKNTILLHGGSIQKITTIPRIIRDVYKISWDLSMKSIIDMSADRGIYICQSQSLNLWMDDPDNSKLSSMHMYSWKKGLKTGMYYLRRRAVAKAQQFSISPEEAECLMCGS